ncbi:DNA invertase Pin-like site-specific DNA recombinase [Rhodoferax ferrireducens]|uniref:DNA invertase Pin-like site-specific DNA recombinase n=1 Tax=Rhodoferax ferrireducens TaxID=192843 RepID=A0ABU2C8S5_9BURK|nr:recombinase family protein [Rhodoferax ferrireducens]MDR7377642.1 DNA invertase Pin-like site-specific DNA recombinase [Rhodoferax ferrireducens]
MLIGYARVSTRDQETDLQLDALHRAGVTEIYEEKASSVGTRPQLRRCLAALRPGDIFVIYKLDRVARSLPDLLSILAQIKAAGALVKSLTEPLDTTTAMGSFVIQILGAVAELERGIIRERSIAGQQAARDRGNLPGRTRALSADAEAEVVKLYATGNYTQNNLAKLFGVSDSVIKRAIYRDRTPGHSSLR